MHPRSCNIICNLFAINRIFRLSIRGASSSGGAKYNYATSWSFHPKEILTFLLPSAFGFGGQAYWGYMPFTDYPNYMGIIVLLLALIATLQKKNFYNGT